MRGGKENGLSLLCVVLRLGLQYFLMIFFEPDVSGLRHFVGAITKCMTKQYRYDFEKKCTISSADRDFSLFTSRSPLSKVTHLITMKPKTTKRREDGCFSYFDEP